jgi:hypothetical protein
MKSQIQSSKFQINSNLQFPMSQNGLNLEILELMHIWDLVLGDWCLAAEFHDPN